ncbi:hypothetical protein NVP1121O_141 [Vibrio phage 1.121.O._10N.286.46.C4]|nr:hypothetical protein NVP1121O_141 [Vibrio phage 1.121.O._10N.286.46.C4]
MKIHKKEIEGFEMEGYNDSNCDWAIRSIDHDGMKREAYYPKKVFTLKRAFELHSDLYRDM